MRYVMMTGLAAALAAISCAHSEPKKVSDADFGRLSPEQTQPVRAARQQQQLAREELARAKLAAQQARQELQLAKADVAAAEADGQRAKAVASAADQSRDPAALARASNLKDEARLHRHAADARVEWANKLIAARDAQVEAAQRHLDMTEAAVDDARLQALQQADIPAASKYDPRALQGRVDERAKAWHEAQQKAARLDGDALAARRAYDDARQQLQAESRGRAPEPSKPTDVPREDVRSEGTGSSAR